MRLGEMRDLHEGRDAAAIRDVGSGQVTPPASIICLNSQTVRMFSPVAIGTPPSRATRAWPATSSGMIGSSSHTRHRVERRGRVGSPRRAPLHVGVGHQRKRVAEMPAQGGNARDIFGQHVAPDLGLDCAKSLVDVAIGLLQQRVDGQMKVDAAGITRNAIAETAEQLPQRSLARFALRSHNAMSNADSASTVGPPRPP